MLYEGKFTLEQIKKHIDVINDELNEQIPLVPNRFDYFYPRKDATQEEIDALNKEYDQCCIAWHFAEVEYYVNEELTEIFNRYLSEHLLTASTLTASDKKTIFNIIYNDATKIYEKIREQKEILNDPITISIEEIKQSLTDNFANNIAKLMNNESLSISNKSLDDKFQFTERTKLEEKLFAERSIYLNKAQVFASNIKNCHSAEEAQLQLTKMTWFYNGNYLAQSKSNTGYCGENLMLALHKLFEKNLVGYIDSLEVVDIDLLDNGKMYNNHVFFIINRDPNKDLKDPTGWGLLWDPWQRIAFKGSEFANLPYQYHCYSKEGEWRSTPFTTEDSDLWANIYSDQTEFEMTDNLDLVKREKVIKDEFALTPLNSKDHSATLSLLNSLLDEVRPENFKLDFEFYITTQHNKPITPISGLAKMGIAIHKDFLDDIAKGKATLTDLKNGLACVTHEIKHFGVKNSDRGQAESYTSIDRDLLEHFHDGKALINYLRYDIEFSNIHKNQIHHIEEDYRTRKRIGQQILEQRIKTIETLLTKITSIHFSNQSQPLPEAVLQELNDIKPYRYFEVFADPLTQINYLISKLKELKVELRPHELNNYKNISARVVEFKQILQSIAIDYSNPDIAHACDNLITKAIELRVPGLKKIYHAISKHNNGLRHLYSKRNDTTLPAIGPFKQYNESINKLNAAKDPQQKKLIAEDILKLLNSGLILHYYHYGTGLAVEQHNKNYRKIHRKSPTGDDRFYGSALGSSIDYPELSNESWTELTSLAISTKDKSLATFLILHGYLKDEILELFSKEELQNFIHQYQGIILCDYGYDNFNRIQKHLLTRLQIDTSMFALNKPLIEALSEYIDKNIELLMDQKSETKNSRSAKTILFEAFESAITSGSTEAKKFVKEFFTKETAKYSLHKIQHLNKYYRLGEHSLYYDFVNGFNSSHFDFFTPQEKLDFMRCELGSHLVNLSPEEYFQLAKINDPTSLSSLEQIFTFLNQNGIDYANPLIHIMLSHVNNNPTYVLGNDNTHTFLKIISQHHIFGENNLLSYACPEISWQLPNDFAHISLEELHHYIFAYRCFDRVCCFPNPEAQVALAEGILQRINQLTMAEKLDTLSVLLLCENNNMPISDYKLATTAINLFVDCLYEKYGLDDGSDEYFKLLKPILDKIDACVSGRDKNNLLSHLYNKIEAQQHIATYLNKPSAKLDQFHYKNLGREDDNNKLIGLSHTSQFFSKNHDDQIQFIEFFSNPLSNKSLDDFTNYIIETHKDNDLLKNAGYDPKTIQSKNQQIRFFILNQYYNFWDLSIEERAVIFNHLLIPADKTITAQAELEAYQAAINYIGLKLFPDANNPASDDHFALSVLRSYLATADEFQRGVLLAGMLVASNDPASGTMSAGKKLASMLEYMGPPYIKLGQGVQSHHATPAQIKNDLRHLKGHANPPHRWQIWDLIKRTLPKETLEQITHVGKLLGSASYNLALEVTLKDGTQAVLILLRDNAASDADKGFAHLDAAINHCDHPRMDKIKQPLLSILREAKRLSLLEMDPVASIKQFAIAKRLYCDQRYPLAPNIHIKPSNLIVSGQGFRIIDKAEGIEFNELPNTTNEDKQHRKEIAIAVVTIELINLLSKDCFDSDRHGNQLRAKILSDTLLGLFDFGEMSPDPCLPETMLELAAIIAEIPEALTKEKDIESALHTIISQHIDADKTPDNVKSDLERIRKAVLALQDFFLELDKTDMYGILNKVKESSLIDGDVKKSLQNTMTKLQMQYLFSGATSFVKSVFSYFGNNNVNKKHKLDNPTPNPIAKQSTSFH